MKRILPLLLALSAGCSGYDRSFQGDPEKPEMPPIPPERVLRQPVDFRFSDFGSGKQFNLRFYHDAQISDEIVTVVEAGKGERLASISERDYALSIFLADWKATGDQDKLRYHLELFENEMKRDATLLDYKIRGKEYEVTQLEEKRDAALFNLRARKETSGFSTKEAKDLHPGMKEGERCTCPLHEASNEELERELATHEINVRLARAELEVYRYRKSVRDGEYSRSSMAFFKRDAISVSDILPAYSSPDHLVALIKTNVEPESWTRSLARIEFKDGYLLVSQRPEVIDRVRSYVEKERIAFRNRPKQK